MFYMSKYILLFFSYTSPLLLLYFFLMVQFLITYNKAGRASALYNFILILSFRCLNIVHNACYLVQF